MLRREFIKSFALAISSLLFAALPAKLLGKIKDHLTCSYCGAQVASWHVYGTSNSAGLFCPNCGIEVRKGVFAFKSSPKYFSFKIKRRSVCRKWECAVVPFPNPDLVVQSGKPKIKLANIKF